jgi:hypothetical protein
LVSPTLQLLDFPEVFAGGNCCAQQQENGCISILILPKIRRFLGMGNGEWGIAKNVFLQI